FPARSGFVWSSLTHICSVVISVEYCSSEEKTVVVLVGLPARGKSYISTKLSRYLNWVGINTRVFNVGAYRRRHMKTCNDHTYFSDDNNEGVAVRQKIASEALDDLLSWLTSEVGEIAVFDATNTTRQRRLWIMERCKAHNLQVIFVESICKDKKLIQENVLEVKVNSPDYESMDKEEALRDFLKRIEHYEKRYESIDDDLDKDWSYIKIFDQGKRYLANRIEVRESCDYLDMSNKLCSKRPLLYNTVRLYQNKIYP
ncbi:unnamed protein product, partial [Trichobilharzia regenti]